MEKSLIRLSPNHFPSLEGVVRLCQIRLPHGTLQDMDMAVVHIVDVTKNMGSW